MELLNAGTHIAIDDCICSTCDFSPQSGITQCEEAGVKTRSCVAGGCEVLLPITSHWPGNRGL